MVIPESLHGLRFVKGHGTENDFVFFADPHGSRGLDAEQARWLCDRRAGIGGDGVIRAIRCDAMDSDDAREGLAAGAEWFMDYRNSDGSISEMCGNGVRAYIAFLLAQGLIDPLDDGRVITMGTRGGVRSVWCEGDNFAVDMGGWTQWHDDSLRAGQFTGVTATGLPEQRFGVGIDVPNPHVIIFVDDEAQLVGLDLRESPRMAPVPPHGANIEFIFRRPSPSPTVGALSMRVFERGSGETRSCGTGVCAAAIASWIQAGGESSSDVPTVWHVHVPGGDLEARIDPQVGKVFLVGPAVLVAEGTLI